MIKETVRLDTLEARVERLERLCEGFLRHTHADGILGPVEDLKGGAAVKASVEAEESARHGG